MKSLFQFFKEMIHAAKVEFNPTPTGRVIDMTRPRWGHNMSISYWWSDPKNSFHAAVWLSQAPRVGDIIQWRTPYGRCDGLIYEVEACRDPWDMYWVDVVVHERHFDETE